MNSQHGMKKEERNMDWMKRWGINIGLVVISIVMTVLLAEVVLRFTPYGRLRNTIPRYYYVPDNMLGHDIAISQPERIWTFRDQIEIDFKISSNELGCFDRPYNGEKRPILLVGDSFTWGYVPFENLYGTIVERLVNKRILKCGVVGYGPKEEGIKIRKVLDKLHILPELIIVGYIIGNDLEDDYLYPQRTVIDGYMVYKKSLDRNTGKVTEFSEKDLVAKLSKFNKFKIYLSQNFCVYILLEKVPLLRKVAAKLGLAEPSEQPQPTPLIYDLSPDRLPWIGAAWEKHLGNLREIKSISASYNSRLLIVLIPAREQIYDFLRPDVRDGDWYYAKKRLAAFFDKEGIEYIDLAPLLREYIDNTPRKFLDIKRDLYWRYDGHYNSNGHQLTALLVAKYIIEKGLIQIEDGKEKLLEIETELKAFKSLLH